MTRPVARIITPDPARRRRCPRPLGLLATVPEHRTAEAMDYEPAAEQLIEDLLALVDAGLIAPVQEYGDDVRYAPTNPDDFAA